MSYICISQQEGINISEFHIYIVDASEMARLKNAAKLHKSN